MSRIVRYTYNSSVVPADPDVNSTVYSNPIAYQAGYYKAKAWENGDGSVVVSSSFERAPEDYIANYEFNGNVLDSTGNYNLTNNGAVLTTGITGNADTAYEFDGADGMMNSIGALSSKSYSMWYYSTNVSLNQCLIFYSNSGNGSGGTTDSIRFISGNINIYSYDGSPKTITSIAIANTWTHIAVTFNNNDYVKLYINGEYKTQMSIGNRWTSGDRHWLGKSSSEFGCGGFIGKMAHTQIYNRVLTQQEITQLYNLG